MSRRSGACGLRGASKGRPALSPSPPLARRASPEALLGERQLPSSDVYSLAVVLWECLARRLPFESGTPWEHHAAVLSGDRPAVSAIRWSEGLEAESAKTSLLSLMEAGWSRDAAARPPMLRFLEVLESLEDGRVITAPIEQEDASALLGSVPRRRRAYEIDSDEVQLGKELARGAYGAGTRTRPGRCATLFLGRSRSRSRLSRPASRRAQCTSGSGAQRRWP